MPLSFMPPRRGNLGRDDAPVDADDAVFEGFRDTADVAAVEIGGDPSLPAPACGEGQGGGVVGHLDRVLLALEAVERGDRPEGLFLW